VRFLFWFMAARNSLTSAAKPALSVSRPPRLRSPGYSQSISTLRYGRGQARSALQSNKMALLASRPSVHVQEGLGQTSLVVHRKHATAAPGRQRNTCSSCEHSSGSPVKPVLPTERHGAADEPGAVGRRGHRHAEQVLVVALVGVHRPGASKAHTTLVSLPPLCCTQGGLLQAAGQGALSAACLGRHGRIADFLCSRCCREACLLA
jgi:hypothetical protein